MTLVEKRQSVKLEFVTFAADEFEKSGIEYSCGAVVCDFAKPLVAEYRKTTEFANHRTFSAWLLEKAVWDEVHRRWKQG